jgi:hypothetical protein
LTSTRTVSLAARTPRSYDKMKFDVKPYLAMDASRNVKGGATVFMMQDDLQFMVRATDETFMDGVGTKGMTLGVKRADHFEFRYEMGEHAPQFVLHTGATVKGRRWHLKMRQSLKPKPSTVLEASTAMNDDNRMTVVYDMSSYDKPDLKNLAVKWCYMQDNLAVEPGYDFGTESLFAEVRYRLDDDNRLKARFDAATNNARLEWANMSGMGGGGEARVVAEMTMDKVGVKKMPSLRVEKMWTVDM